MRLKDEMLDRIAEQGVNIGQFVSFGPDRAQRFARIRGVDPSHRYGSFVEAIHAIIQMGIPYVNGTVWIVHLHVGRCESVGNVIYPGEPKRLRFLK